jgi:gas vesicle protein
MNTGKVLLGFMAGISAGAMLGVLFAPGKGASTRNKIIRRGDEYLAGLGEKFNEFIDGISEKFDNAREEAMRLADNGKAKMDAVDKKIISSLK